VVSPIEFTGTPHPALPQLSEALALISTSDFPEQWPSLLTELVAKLQGSVAGGEWATAKGVLDTAAR
jgi:hypothetical protein